MHLTVILIVDRIPGKASSGVGIVEGLDIASPIPKNSPAVGCCLRRTVLKTSRNFAVLLVCIRSSLKRKQKMEVRRNFEKQSYKHIHALTTPYVTSFRRRSFAYHQAVNHSHTNIILS